jgi:hypothetical protein
MTDTLSDIDFLTREVTVVLPGIDLNFSPDTATTAFTHSVSVTLVVIGMETAIKGGISVRWPDDQFAKLDKNIFKDRVEAAITAILYDGVRLSGGSLVITKLPAA